MSKVKVYFFECFDIMSGSTVQSRRPATREAIAAAKGKAIEETEQEVESSMLDGNGFLKDK